MTPAVRSPASPSIGRRSAKLRAGAWAVLLTLSAIFAVALEALQLPAALMLGPMAAAIVLALIREDLRVPRPAHAFAQGIVGCMIASNIPFSVFGEIGKNGPLFVAGVVSAIAASAALGWLLARWKVLPGTTAVWGSSPGAAMAMTLMAEDYGADVRLVAFMQYLRVVCVALAATLVAGIWTAGAHPPAATIWFPPIAILPFAGTVMLAGGGALVARRLHIPAGALLLPLVAGIALRNLGTTFELPPWLLAISYALVGWGIGMRFTKPILLHALHALPRVLAAILTLIAFCGLFAMLLVHLAGIDPLTAYLATSPGGVDSVAIIAASSKEVDLPFVMAMQTVRLMLVLATGPSLARFIARRIDGGKPSAQ
jgi:uncharacterized protein